MFESDLASFLAANAGVAALVSDANGARISPLPLPEGSIFPALTYHMVAAPPDQAFDGDGLVQARMQIDCWCDGASGAYGGAAQLAIAVRQALDSLAGAMGTTDVRGVQCINRGTASFEDARRLYRRMLEFYFWYYEA